MDLIDSNGTESASMTPRSSTPKAPAGTSRAEDSPNGTGKTVINDGVVAKVAGLAARDVAGVHALGGGAARALGAIREAMKSTDVSQGVSVEVGETQVAVDVTIVADYPVQLQQVANDIRTNVIRAVEDLVGLEVTEVNVTIVDIHLPSDDDADSAEPTKAALR